MRDRGLKKHPLEWTDRAGFFGPLSDAQIRSLDVISKKEAIKRSFERRERTRIQHEAALLIQRVFRSKSARFAQERRRNKLVLRENMSAVAVMDKWGIHDRGLQERVLRKLRKLGLHNMKDMKVRMVVVVLVFCVPWGGDPAARTSCLRTCRSRTHCARHIRIVCGASSGPRQSRLR